MRLAKIFAAFVCLAILLIGAHAVGNPSCSGHLRHDKALTINGKTVFLQAALSPAEQQKGLGGQSCIGKNEGMLFEFAKPDYYQFWMKDTKFSLDIIWLDANKKAVTELQGISPSTYPQTFVSTEPAQYVIELPAGQASDLGISQSQIVKF